MARSRSRARSGSKLQTRSSAMQNLTDTPFVLMKTLAMKSAIFVNWASEECGSCAALVDVGA